MTCALNKEPILYTTFDYLINVQHIQQRLNMTDKYKYITIPFDKTIGISLTICGINLLIKFRRPICFKNTIYVLLH